MPVSIINGSVYIRNGAVPVTAERCCCDTEATWEGDGWYCVESWVWVQNNTCAGTASSHSKACARIETQVQWDAYQFGTCTKWYPDLSRSARAVTDGTKHVTEDSCDANCAL